MSAQTSAVTEVAKGLRISRSTLLTELALIQTVIERKNTLPVLAKILIEADCTGKVSIRGTDLDVSLATTITASVGEPISVAVDARKIFDIVRSLPEGDIEIAPLANGYLSVCAGSARFKLASQSAEHFPAAPGATPLEHEIAADLLGRSIDRVAFAITREESRYTLSGALVIIKDGAMSLVATDGHRLSADEIPVASPASAAGVHALFPRKGLAALRKLVAAASGPVAFGADDNQFQVRIGDRLLTSRRLSGAFPEFEKVIPTSNDGEAVISREALDSALGRVLLVSDERSKSVSVEIGEGRATLRAQASEVGEAVESVDLAGGTLSATIGVNGNYVADFLAVAGSEEVKISYRDASSPLLFEPVGENSGRFRHVVMPLRQAT